MALLDERLIKDPYLQTLTGYGNDAVAQPIPTEPTDAGIPYGPDTVVKPVPTTPTTTTTTPTSGGAFWMPRTDFQQFNQLLYGSTTIPNDLKTQISGLARTAATGAYSAQEIQSLHQAIFNSALPQDLKVQLSNLVTYQANAPKTATPTGGGGGGGGGTSGGGGTGAHEGGGTSGQFGISGQIGAYPGDVANTSLDWVNALLGGDFSSVPMFDELTDPKYADPTQNPYIQSMIGSLQGEMQEDWLGQQAALAEAAEAQGRYGSGLYQALSSRATEETQEALASAISQMYMGAYENERQRRAGLFGTMLGAQGQAAQLPIQVGQLGVNQAQLGLENRALGIQAGHLSLARDQFAFQKKMGLLGAQQDALSDYLAVLLGIGGLGGTQTNVGGGQYVPTMSSSTAALLGGLSGLTNYWSSQNVSGGVQ